MIFGICHNFSALLRKRNLGVTSIVEIYDIDLLPREIGERTLLGTFKRLNTNATIKLFQLLITSRGIISRFVTILKYRTQNFFYVNLYISLYFNFHAIFRTQQNQTLSKQ